MHTEGFSASLTNKMALMKNNKMTEQFGNDI